MRKKFDNINGKQKKKMKQNKQTMIYLTLCKNLKI